MHFVVPKLLLVPIAHGFVQNVWTGFAIYRPQEKTRHHHSPLYVSTFPFTSFRPLPFGLKCKVWSCQQWWKNLEVNPQNTTYVKALLSWRHWQFCFSLCWHGPTFGYCSCVPSQAQPAWVKRHQPARSAPYCHFSDRVSHQPSKLLQACDDLWWFVMFVSTAD